MSIHYLLDGYNVIHRMPGLNLTKLEDQRRYLVRFIEQYTPQGSPKNPVTIVFDGSPHIFGRMTSTAAKVIFSQGETADDMIKKIVAEAQNTKKIVVVSDDRDIQYAVRALGAKTSGVQAFLNMARPPAKKKRMSGSTKEGSFDPEKCIPKTDAHRITSELERIWLRSNAGSGD